MIRHYGGSHGVRDMGLVESALARPRAGFGDYEAYANIFTKAAVLAHSLLKNHPFVDGNKRTALACCMLFLKRNGYMVQSSKHELLTFALSIENNSLAEDKIAEWLTQHAEQDKR